RRAPDRDGERLPPPRDREPPEASAGPFRLRAGGQGGEARPGDAALDRAPARARRAALPPRRGPGGPGGDGEEERPRAAGRRQPAAPDRAPAGAAARSRGGEADPDGGRAGPDPAAQPGRDRRADRAPLRSVAHRAGLGQPQPLALHGPSGGHVPGAEVYW